MTEKTVEIIHSDSTVYIKRYSDLKALMKEWTALQSCQGEAIQKAISRNDDKLEIHYEYDKSAIPLSHFEPHQSGLFVEMLPTLIKAIQQCHSKGWVHGDIKPSNILYFPEARTVRLIDFGASERIGVVRSQLEQWQLTLSFASENQVKGLGTVEPDDDWYSLLRIIDQVIKIETNEHVLNQIKLNIVSINNQKN